MSKYIKIKKGLNIKLAGEANQTYSTLPLPETFVIKPPDFIGLSPKLLVKAGDNVQAGTALFSDKKNDAIQCCSPVSGEVIEIVRGEKRKLLEIKILADKEIMYVPFNREHPAKLSREAIIGSLLSSGVWPFIRQRPFGIIANPNETPKSIFISAFDSNPLAPDNDFILAGQDVVFQAGLDALQKLTTGKVHLNIHADIKRSNH
jgi:Na+-transporting NADH:ubiquinone oxidoreductase subunit A